MVTKDWLLACQRDNSWVSEQPFLVGDCTTFTKDRPLPREPQEEKDETLTTEETRLEVEDNQDVTMEDVRCRFEVMDEDADNTNNEITFGRQVALGGRGPNTPGPGTDTPTMQRLRPKPIDVENITVTPQVKSDPQGNISI